jgi:uncharacterized membrane protein YidH (DUF202 family)
MELFKLIDNITEYIIDPIILLLFGLGFLYFLWGIAKFIWNADSEDARKEGADHMIWGIVGMFIMVAAFGIISLIKNSIGV